MPSRNIISVGRPDRRKHYSLKLWWEPEWARIEMICISYAEALLEFRKEEVVENIKYDGILSKSTSFVKWQLQKFLIIWAENGTVWLTHWQKQLFSSRSSAFFLFLAIPTLLPGQGMKLNLESPLIWLVARMAPQMCEPWALICEHTVLIIRLGPEKVLYSQHLRFCLSLSTQLWMSCRPQQKTLGPWSVEYCGLGMLLL